MCYIGENDRPRHCGDPPCSRVPPIENQPKRIRYIVLSHENDRPRRSGDPPCPPCRQTEILYYV